MLEIKLLRDDPIEVAKQLVRRGFQLDVAHLTKLETQRKKLQIETQTLQNQRNTQSRIIGQAKGKGEAVTHLLAQMADLGKALEQAEKALNSVQAELHQLYSTYPNIPHASVPEGLSENENQVIRQWGTIPQFTFEPKDHVALGETGLDFESAARISGARFVVLHGLFARLHRALGQYMLDLHIHQHGYEEVHAPYLVSGDCLYGTGQFPRLKEDTFGIEGDDLWLIPTSEVSITNLARNQILEGSTLPKKYVCYSPCFRKEAGTYGKDMRGMLRQHQFDKVELLHWTDPQDSYAALETLLAHAEAVLQGLALPYRVVSLCAGDLGFASAKTYDLEVWLPGQNQYREISSCSNFESFQARRMGARYRTLDNKPTPFHTLNGSGLAVGRTFIAILENYQDSQGRIRVPKNLLPYMHGVELIEPLNSGR